MIFGECEMSLWFPKTKEIFIATASTDRAISSRSSDEGGRRQIIMDQPANTSSSSHDQDEEDEIIIWLPSHSTLGNEYLDFNKFPSHYANKFLIISSPATPPPSSWYGTRRSIWNSFNFWQIISDALLAKRLARKLILLPPPHTLWMNLFLIQQSDTHCPSWAEGSFNLIR